MSCGPVAALAGKASACAWQGGGARAHAPLPSMVKLMGCWMGGRVGIVSGLMGWRLALARVGCKAEGGNGDWHAQRGSDLGGVAAQFRTKLENPRSPKVGTYLPELNPAPFFKGPAPI